MRKMIFMIGGSSTKNPMKNNVRTALQNGDVSIVLIAEGNKVNAYYQGETDAHLAGSYVAVADDSLGYTPLFEVIDYLNRLPDQRGSAVATQSLSGQFIVEFEITDVVSVVNDDEFKDEMNRIEQEGILTKEEIQKRIQYMLTNYVQTESIIKILKTYRAYPLDVEKKIILNPKTLYVDSSGIIKKSVAFINGKKNLLYEGERGVGKNVLTETLSWMYHRPLYEFSFNSQHDNSTLLGSNTFEDVFSTSNPEEEIRFFEKASKIFQRGIKRIFSGEKTDAEDVMDVVKKLASYTSGNKKIVFNPSTIILSAIYGGILVMDEVNTTPGHTLSAFNSMLDDRRRITLEGYGSVVADSNFFAISTINKDYRDVFELNEAFRDRFVKIKFPNNDSIATVLKRKVPNARNEIITTCDEIYGKILEAIREGTLSSKSISIRGFINAVEATTEEGLDLKDALLTAVANQADEEFDYETIVNLITWKVG